MHTEHTAKTDETSALHACHYLVGLLFSYVVSTNEEFRLVCTTRVANICISEAFLSIACGFIYLSYLYGW